MNIEQQQQQKQKADQYNKPYAFYSYQHLTSQQAARPNCEMTPNNAANPQMNTAPDQHRYIIPPPFGNMQFAAQRRQRSQTPMHQQIPNQSQQQDQQPQHHNYTQGHPPMEQAQPQVPYYQGAPPMDQGQQYYQQNMMRRMPLTHMLSSYSVRKYLSNMAILRVHEIINQINLSMGKVDDYGYWTKFTRDIFTPHGVMRYARKNGDDTRLFEFAMPIIPSLLKFLGSTGVVRIELVPQQLRVQVLSNGTIFFECPRCTVTYFYPDGSYMTNFSQIKGIFDSALKIEWCDICTYSFVPGIEWNSLERVLSDQKVSYQIFQALSDPNARPHHSNEENKDYSSQKRESQQTPSNFSAITQLRSQFKVFHNISSFGIHESFMRVLQVNDVMSYLESLKICQKLNNIKSPLESLSTFVAASEESRVGTGHSMKPSSINLNGATNMAQTMGTPQPQTPSSSSSFLNAVPYKHQDRKQMKKRKSTDALSPTTTGDSTKSPTESSNNENNANPYKKVKF